MKAIITITLIGYFGVTAIHAQSLRYPAALPYTSLSAYSNSQSDPFSFTFNQAALASVKNISVGIYGERRFLLSATAAYRLATVFPSRMGNFGLKLDYAGFKNFNETTLGLAYGRSLGKTVDLGIQFNYYGYRVPAYGNANAINFEVGAIFHFTGKLNGGIHVYNPIGGKLGKAGNEKLAANYTAGLGYDASPHFFVTGVVIKEEDRPVNVVCGIQYQFARQFFFRGGVISESGSAFAGVGAGWNNIRLDLSVSYHPQLGFSPGIFMVAGFGKKG